MISIRLIVQFIGKSRKLGFGIYNKSELILWNISFGKCMEGSKEVRFGSNSELQNFKFRKESFN